MKKQYSIIVVLLSFCTINFGQTVCNIDSIAHNPNAQVLWSPDGQKFLLNQLDTAGVYQIYVGNKGSSTLTCISAKDTTGNCCGLARHWYQRNKLQVNWHPSGKWIICAVEKEWYAELLYTPHDLLYDLLETGWQMDIWAVAPDGGKWFQLVNTTKGFTGPAFTPDGKTCYWADEQDTSKTTDAFGLWYLQRSSFTDTGAVGPRFPTTTNINPAGARWIEPGNVSPDGKSLLVSSDIGLTDAEGQDQFIIDVAGTNPPVNLTHSPKVWDEHGIFSPDGKKVLFMSSFQFRADTNSYKVLNGLKTEFYLMDVAVTSADSAYYPGLQQLTHFNTPGYTESASTGAVAATGIWNTDGSQIQAQDLFAPAYDNWIIYFKGNCGNSSISTAVTENKKTVNGLAVYPNPANTEITLSIADMEMGNYQLQIVNVLGQQVYEQIITISSSGQMTIPLKVENLKAGTYFLNLIGNRETQRTRLLKE